MASIRTKAKIQFIEEILKVFTDFSHSGKGYLEYLKSPKGGDEFDIRDYLIKPILLKLGYEQSDLYNEVTINAGEVDLNIGEASLKPFITVETKSTNSRDLKSARVDQLFPYIKELHTPIGVVTNGILFEIWEQKEKYISQVVALDFLKIVSDYLKGGIASISDDDFIRIGKLSYLKKELLSIKEEDLYKIPEIDVSEATAFKNLLTDIAGTMEVVKAAVEEIFSIRQNEYKDFQERKETLSGWQLEKLKKERKNAINTMRSYQKWAEINNIDLSKNGNAREKFITETMYILINRILLIRIAEDKNIIPRRISNGGIKDFKQFIRETKINYNKLLYIAFDTMREVYEHFFKEDIFDWYNPDSELLLRVLYIFNRYNFAHVNREILGNLYQKYIDREERKRLGQFYTPEEVVDYILDGVGYKDDQVIEGKTLLDPACGSGGFLVPAVNRLVERLRSKNFDAITILDKVRDNIYGFDINPFAAHLAETNLLFQVMDLISEAKKLDPAFKMDQFNVFVTDSLKIPEEGLREKQTPLFENNLAFSTASMDAEVVKDIKLKRGRFAGGVDFVVGNPPWGGILKKEKGTMLSQQLMEYYVSAVGKYDIYVLFIESGIKWLKNNGKFGYIVQNRFLKSDYGEKLREYILETCKIDKIVDFGDTKVFSDATNYPCIIIFEKKPTREEEIIYIEVNKKADELSPEEVIEFVKMPAKATNFLSILRIRQSSLKNSIAWNPGQIRMNLILDRVEGIRTLGDLCEKIIEGVTFGGKGSDEIFCVSEKVVQEFNLEEKLLKKVLKGRDIRKWRISWNDRFLVYPYDEIGKEVSLKEFSNIHKYLKRFQSTLARRILDGKEISEWGKVWYSFWRIRTSQVFESRKIVSPRISKANSFALDQGGDYYLTDSAVAIITKNLDLKYLLGLLNSTLLFSFIKNTSPFVQGRYYSYTRAYLEKLPIKVPINEKEKQIANEIITDVDKILNLGNIENFSSFENLIEKFKFEFPQYSDIQLIPLSDIPGLTHIQLEKRMGKPKISREGKRVYLARKSYIDVVNEDLAEYMELYLKSIQETLRGLTKPDILRVVKVPQDEKMVETLLFHNRGLKDERKELNQKRNEIDREIDRKIYELYGLSEEEIRTVEESL